MSARASLHTLFENTFGSPPHHIAAMAGDGSARRMFRITGQDGRTVVGVHGPDAAENRAFLTYSRNLKAARLPVPDLYAANEDEHVYLVEDLGNATLFDVVKAARKAHPDEAFPSTLVPIYRRVLEWLPKFQVLGGREIDYSVAYPRDAFDRQSVLWDLNYFKYHFLKLAHVPFDEARLERDFRRFSRFLMRAPRSFFLYRDFQSRNIMIRGSEPSFIDYQGGRKGALQYDVASLLYDAKAGLPQDVRDELLEHYLESLSELVEVDRERFRMHLRGYVLVRIMQAMGAYGYRGFYERKPRFLASVPPAIDNIERLLDTGFVAVEVPEIRAVMERICASSTLRRRPEQLPPGLTVSISSFSYKRGYPSDASGHGGGYVFDCRAIPNPGRESRYAVLTGLDEPVRDFLGRRDEADSFWHGVELLVDQQVNTYLERKFSSLTVAFGCTGGQHRSVFFAERLGRFLRDKYPEVNVRLDHREAQHWPES